MGRLRVTADEELYRTEGAHKVQATGTDDVDVPNDPDEPEEQELRPPVAEVTISRSATLSHDTHAGPFLPTVDVAWQATGPALQPVPLEEAPQLLDPVFPSRIDLEQSSLITPSSDLPLSSSLNVVEPTLTERLIQLGTWSRIPDDDERRGSPERWLQVCRTPELYQIGRSFDETQEEEQPTPPMPPNLGAAAVERVILERHQRGLRSRWMQLPKGLRELHKANDKAGRAQQIVPAQVRYGTRPLPFIDLTKLPNPRFKGSVEVLPQSRREISICVSRLGESWQAPRTPTPSGTGSPRGLRMPFL